MYSRGKNKGQEKKPMTASPDKYPQGYFKEKGCKECGNLFTPQAPSQLYCCGECSSKGFTRKYLKKQYDITYEQYMEMYNKFEGRCHICKQIGFKIDINQKLDLAVDHCHTTGVVRGMLCHNCNRGLGLFQDNPSYLTTAVEYLERATTIPKGSTPKQVEAHSPSISEGEDIV